MRVATHSAVAFTKSRIRKPIARLHYPIAPIAEPILRHAGELRVRIAPWDQEWTPPHCGPWDCALTLLSKIAMIIVWLEACLVTVPAYRTGGLGSARLTVRSFWRTLTERDVAGATIHVHPALFGREARSKPSFPSDPEYEAKAWEFMTARKGQGQLVFWNVAGPAA